VGAGVGGAAGVGAAGAAVEHAVRTMTPTDARTRRICSITLLMDDVSAV
jgi:hypothetical protein